MCLFVFIAIYFKIKLCNFVTIIKYLCPNLFGKPKRKQKENGVITMTTATIDQLG